MLGVASGVFSTLVADGLRTRKIEQETSCLFTSDIERVRDTASRIKSGSLVSELERPNTPMLDGAPITTVELSPKLRLKILNVQNEWNKLCVSIITIPLTLEDGKREKEMEQMRKRAEELSVISGFLAETLHHKCGH